MRNHPDEVRQKTAETSVPYDVQPPVGSDRPSLFLDIKADAHKLLLSYWENVRGSRTLPARADLDMVRLIPVLPNIVLFSVKTDPLDFIYKVIGENALRNFTSNFTGKALSTLPGKGPGSKVFDTFTSIIETKMPNLLKVPYVGPNKDFKTIHTLALPFASDRENVDQIMVVVEFITIV